MYIWNDIRISAKGTHQKMLEIIGRYINACSVTDSENCDISVNIDNVSDIPDSIDSDAELVRSVEFMVEPPMKLDIFFQKPFLWLKYDDKALLTINSENNTIDVKLTGLPIDFEYYNALVFFLHPLGTLLENFGFFRLHASCSAINGSALLVTGHSGSGKSTAGFAVPVHGGILIADDLTYVQLTDSGFTASSLSSLLKLRDDSLERFYPELDTAMAVCTYEDETYFSKEYINKTKHESALIHGIAILSRTNTSATDYSVTRPTNVIPHLFPSTIHLHIPENAERKFGFISGMLDEISAYEINIGNDMNIYYENVEKILKGSSHEK